MLLQQSVCVSEQLLSNHGTMGDKVAHGSLVVLLLKATHDWLHVTGPAAITNVMSQRGQICVLAAKDVMRVGWIDC